MGSQSDKWTPREDSLVVKLYPDYDALCRRLPHRTYRAITFRCTKLKVAVPKAYWTGPEHHRLRRLWPTASKRELALAFPNRTHDALEAQARILGLVKKRIYVSSGQPILDEVRKRARALGYSMSDLDALCKSAIYFQTSCRKGHKPNMVHVQAAVRKLGGEFQIKWKDD